MKNPALKNSFGLFIFLMIELLAFLAVRPVYVRLTETVNSRVENGLRQLEERTGLSLTYDSFSPSILTGFRIKGIVLKDISGGQTVVKIKKATFRYSIVKLIRRDFASACRDLTIDGFTLDFDRDANGEVFEKISAFINYSGGKNPTLENAVQAGFNPDSVNVELPFDVFVKNVSVRYKSGGREAAVLFKKLTLEYARNAGKLDVKSKGGVELHSGSDIFSCNFSADSSVYTGLSGSSLILRISDFSNGKYTLGRLNLLFSYADRSFDFKTVQNAYPFFLHGIYSIDSGIAELSAMTDNLRLSSIFSSVGRNRAVKKLSGISAGINARVKYDTKTGAFNYDSSGKINITEQVVKGGLNAEYSFYGNKEQVTVDSLYVAGGRCNADFSGTYVYKGMKLSGSANLNSFVLPNGGVIATELYFDPLDSGFMCFAPQLMMNEKAFTALQLNVRPGTDSVDFDFELSDYAHNDEENPGQIRIDGSYISGRKFFQAGVSASGMYLDSLAQTGVFFAGKNKSSDSSFGFLSSYMLNGELFVSSDFRTVSYNVPYSFIANTKNDGQFVYLSLDGNDSSVQVSRLDVISKGNTVHLSAQFEKSPDSSDAFFTADINAGSVPYHLTGNIMPGILSVTGDYGFVFDVHKSGASRYDGAFSFENLPVPAGRTIFAVAADTGFSYSSEDGVNMRIARLEVEEAGERIAFEPKFALTGSVTKYGAIFDSISYADMFSSLDGNAQLLWNINNGIFDSVSLEFNMKNPLEEESAEITAQVTNPGHEQLSGKTFKNSLYLNSQIILRDFGLNRFTAQHSKNNSLTATMIVSGVLENPYIGLNIDSLNLAVGGNTVMAGGSAYVEEKNLTVDSFYMKYNKMTIDSGKASFALDTFTGKASAELNADFMNHTVNLPLELSVSDTVIKPGSILPSEFAANLITDSVSGTMFKDPFPFSLTVLHSEGNTVLFTSESIGLSGQISDSGYIDFSMAEGKPVQFNVNGSVSGKDLDISVSELSADLGQLFSYVNIEDFKLFSGDLQGSIKISGLKSDPEFLGAVSIRNADFSLPKIVPSHITVPRIIMTLNHNEINVPEVTGKIKNGCPLSADMKILFNRWSFDRLEARVFTPENVFGPATLITRSAEFDGEACINLGLAFEDSYLDVTGDVAVRNTRARTKTREIAAGAAPVERSVYVRTDLNIKLGSHVSFAFDPLLRCVFVPNSMFSFKYDEENSSFIIDGDISLRSGDIAYLSRSFYLKNGSLKFNSNDPTFNPLITVRAETRERDEDGNEVRIILSADNQYLSDFNPQFSSIPAKSENEIRTMLGQIAVGDSSNVSSFLLATSDYAIQSTLGRTLENKLRDLLNFDIFSVRTMVLQNALKQGLSDRSNYSDMTIGNLLDNSTVYIGKYFGSALYVDALLHWSYDESRIDDKMTAGGLVFRPEFGLEMESPFANIRWNMSPDIDAMLNNRIISSTSVTLSWKFSF